MKDTTKPLEMEVAPEDYETMLGSFTQGPFVWHVFLG